MKRKNPSADAGSNKKKSKKSNLAGKKTKSSNLANGKAKSRSAHNRNHSRKIKAQKQGKKQDPNSAGSKLEIVSSSGARTSDAPKLKNGSGDGPKDKPNNFAKKTHKPKKFRNEAKKANIDRKKLIKAKEGKSDTTGEKPNWLEYKKEQKELREKRRAKKFEDAYDVVLEAKRLGEKLRRSKLSPESQQKLTKKLYDLLQGQYPKMINAHDLSRVIQWQIKYSEADLQLAICEELKPLLPEMIFSKYAKNVARTLIKHGSDGVKKSVLAACNGLVVKLLSSVLSAALFEKLYAEVASDSEKSLLKQELYSNLYKKSKEPKIKSLSDVYKDSEAMKTATLSTVKHNLVRILNKKLVNSSLVHTVLYEYLSSCSKEDRSELIALLRPLMAELSQSRDGSRAANICIWQGSNKDRKLMMKSLKEHVARVASCEHGHLIILALLDSVDDTVLLRKLLLEELLAKLEELRASEYGRRVILYAVARRDTCHFHPALVEYLRSGDGNEASKKPAEIREREILEALIDELLAGIAGSVESWLTGGGMQLLTLAILKASRGDKARAAFEAVARFIKNPESKLQKDEVECEAIEEPGLHMVLKKLIKMDERRREAGEVTFGEVLNELMSGEEMRHWLRFNRGCFLLVNLMENEAAHVVEQLKKKLRQIRTSVTLKSKGASLLLERIDK